MHMEGKHNIMNHHELETVDQWSTTIPPPSRRGSSGQSVDYNWT